MTNLWVYKRFPLPCYNLVAGEKSRRSWARLWMPGAASRCHDINPGTWNLWTYSRNSLSQNEEKMKWKLMESHAWSQRFHHGSARSYVVTQRHLFNLCNVMSRRSLKTLSETLTLSSWRLGHSSSVSSYEKSRRSWARGWWCTKGKGKVNRCQEMTTQKLFRENEDGFQAHAKALQNDTRGRIQKSWKRRDSGSYGGKNLWALGHRN